MTKFQGRLSIVIILLIGHGLHTLRLDAAPIKVIRDLIKTPVRGGNHIVW